MITFNDDGLKGRLQHAKICSGINVGFLTVIFIAALVIAVCSKYAESNWGLYVGGLVFWGVLALVYVVCLFAIFLPAAKAAKRGVCETIAQSLLTREDFFTGGEEIEFVAEYSGDCLTLSRKGYTGEILIEPSRLQNLKNLGGEGAKIEFDLAPLAIVPSVYSTVGTALWQFLQAYYAIKGAQGGVKRVFITDCMGKKPTTLAVFNDGAPAKTSDKNYFIKKGLIK